MSIFKGNLGNYRVILTEDQTETLFSEFFDEACHNISGAYAETIHNYIQGCSIPKLIDQNTDFAVLDVGFGIGIGLKALVNQIQTHTSFTAKASYYSIELDESLIQWALEKTFLGRSLIKKENLDLIYFEGKWGNLEVKIFIGDGRLTLPKAFLNKELNYLDAIFQDPFSPKKNPELWSVQWFEFLKKISNKNVHLSTYSSSISIRKSLIAAGWSIENAKGFAQKRTMTIAKLNGETSLDILEQLKRSPSIEIIDNSFKIE